MVELWRNGNLLEGADQVIEVDKTTTHKTPHSTTTSTHDPVLENTDEESNEKELTSERTTAVLLDRLRQAIRQGDKTVHFTFDDGGSSSSNNQRSRRPKFDNTSSDDMESLIKDLREETENNNKKFLLSVFRRVNGDVGKRKRRYINYKLHRNINMLNR